LARNGAVTLDNNTITLCAADDGEDGDDDISINALFGEGVSGTQQTAFGASNLFGSAMMREAAFWADGTGQDLNGITPKKNQPMKLGVFDGAPVELVTDSYQPRTWRAWAAGFGGRGELDGDANVGSADLNSHTLGFAVGIDAQIDRTVLVGIAAGYSNSGFSVDERATSGTVEGFHAGLYGVKRLGALYVEADAEYVRFYNTTDRFIDWVVDEQAQGQFDSDAFSAHVESGWRRAYGEHRVTPFVGLRVAHLRSDEFTEASHDGSGGPGILGLTFDPNSVTSVASSLGVQFDTRITLYNGQVLTPFARVAWVHEFNPDRGVDSFLTLSPEAVFTAEGAAAASDAAKIYAGLKLDLAENIGLFGYFDGELSDRSQSYAGTGAIKISW
jgi:outer membrane autotransporter protein